MSRTIDDVSAILPHREPILLVRSVAVEAPGERGRGRVMLDPAPALLAGVDSADLLAELLLEGAAQTFGVVLASGRRGQRDPREGRHLLLGLDKVAFVTRPVTGEAEVDLCLEQAVGDVCRGRFDARQNGREVASGWVSVMRG